MPAIPVLDMAPKSHLRPLRRALMTAPLTARWRENTLNEVLTARAARMRAMSAAYTPGPEAVVRGTACGSHRLFRTGAGGRSARHPGAVRAGQHRPGRWAWATRRQQFFRQVLAIEPARLEALVNLANLLRSQGQFDAAIALLEPALARDPGARNCT